MKRGFLLGLLGALVLSCASGKGRPPLSEEEVAQGLEKPFRDLQDKGEWEHLIARLALFRARYPQDYRFDDLREEAVRGLKEGRLTLIEKGEFSLALDKGESLAVLGVAFNPSQEEVLACYLESLKGESPGRARALAYYYRQKGLRVPAEFGDWISTPAPQSSDLWLKATLTLIVDQGIRLQPGRGGVPARGLGSAFIIDPQGYALTNYHVISSEVDKNYKGYSRLYARLPSGKGERLKADVIGYNEELDVALIKVHFPVEHAFNMWNDRSDALRIGQAVYALGAPLGLEQTITSGILSARNRTLLPIGDAFQLDAAVNQGNSGGPVINPQGDVLGMVFAGIPGFEGLNFAISAQWLRLFLPFLYEKGPTYSGWLGLGISESLQGLEVIHAVRGGPTDKLLKPGDKVLSWNGRRLNSITDFQREVLTYRSLGHLTWGRGEEVLSALVLPQERPQEPAIEIFKRSSPEEFLSVVLGLNLEAGKKTLFYRQYRVSHVFPNTPAEDLNINPSDQLEVYTLKLEKTGNAFALGFLIRRQVAGFMESPMGILLPTKYSHFI